MLCCCVTDILFIVWKLFRVYAANLSARLQLTILCSSKVWVSKGFLTFFPFSATLNRNLDQWISYNVFTLFRSSIMSIHMLPSLLLCLYEGCIVFQWVCRFVCPLAYLENHNFAPNFAVHVACCGGSVLLWRCCDASFASGFVDDIVSSHCVCT